MNANQISTPVMKGNSAKIQLAVSFVSVVLATEENNVQVGIII